MVAVPVWDGRAWWDGGPIAVWLVDLADFLRANGLHVTSRFDLCGSDWTVEVARGPKDLGGHGAGADGGAGGADAEGGEEIYRDRPGVGDPEGRGEVSVWVEEDKADPVGGCAEGGVAVEDDGGDVVAVAAGEAEAWRDWGGLGDGGVRPVRVAGGVPARNWRRLRWERWGVRPVRVAGGVPAADGAMGKVVYGV